LHNNTKQNILFLIFVIAIALSWCVGKFFYLDTESIGNSLIDFPILISGFIFVLLYILITFFIFFTKDFFWLMGAVLFGPVLSTIFITIAETVNAFVFFYLARILGRGFVEKKLSKKYKVLDGRIGGISFFWLFLLRAAPLIPYRFLDLTCGLTKIRFRKYLLAVILGTPIKTFWIQYVLAGVGRSVFENPYLLVEYFSGNKVLLLFGLFYIILVIAVIFKLKRPKT